MVNLNDLQVVSSGPILFLFGLQVFTFRYYSLPQSCPAQGWNHQEL